MAVPYTMKEGDKSLLSSVQLWMSRLQLLTAVTAFFASTDGLLLGRVGTYNPNDTSVGSVLTYTTLAGALALHTSAAVISYLASFVLVKYNRISVPVTEEAIISSPGPEAAATTSGGIIERQQLGHLIPLHSLGQKPIAITFDPMITIERVYLRNFFRTRPFMQAPTPDGTPSTPDTVTAPELQDAYNVLLRCNTVCVTLTFVGLLLALIGIMSYVWTTFTLAPGIFVSACIIVSLVGACYGLR